MSVRRASIGDERGIALASAMIILSVVMLIVAAVVTLTITTLSEARRDRASTQAFALADSAIDVVTWQFNRHLTSVDSLALRGITAGVATTDGCLELSGSAVELVMETDVNATFCGPVPIPNLAGSGPATCYSQVNVGVALNDPINLDDGRFHRNVICQAEVNDVKFRIKARMAVQIDGGNPSTLWRRQAWVECTSEIDPADPDQGCPAIPA